jgi:hypothetical protein
MDSETKDAIKPVELVPIDSLIPHPDNPRKGNLDAVVESIQSNGFYGSLVVQKSTRHILVGNHRWEALSILGYTEVPVTFMDVDDGTATKILLADNRTADLATYDDEALVAMLCALVETDDLDGSGYSENELDDLLASLIEDTESLAPDDPGQTLAEKYKDSPISDLVPGGEGFVVTNDDSGDTSSLPKRHIISYQLVFDDDEQQSRFYAFVRMLKSKYEGATLAARLDVFLTEALGE